mmetsp:Transcript_22736/g.31815  ORF Transcript_22736/g.31815 Transcript_22736/m.31815 type:complete len:270 (-) Transcript_22736:23-832(-)
MDTDGGIKVCLRRSLSHRYCKPLSHLSSVGSKNVEPNNSLIARLVAYQLSIAVLLHSLRQKHFQRSEGGVVHLDVIVPIFLDRVLFAQSNGSILQRREDSCWNEIVAHKRLPTLVEARCEQPSSLDSHRGQLQLFARSIANAVNVGHWCLLVGRGQDLPESVELESQLVNIQPFRLGNTADSHEQCINFHACLLAAVFRLISNLDFPLFRLLSLHRHKSAQKLGACLLHIGPDFVRHLLVKTTKKNRTDHHCCVVAESCEESGAFKSDV